MPLFFEEVAPDPKSKKDAKKDPKSRPAILPERKGPPPAPQHLDSQVIPTLIRRVGDWKSGRISQAMCEAYLDRHTLVFDRELLTKMFAEADYQKQGSLDTRALTIAVSGRFPKREHTTEWRILAALLLGLPELVLTDDPEVSATLRATHERPLGGGTYNAANIWDSPPPPLPPVRRRSRSGRRAVPAVTTTEPSDEWQGTLRAIAAAEAAALAGPGPGSLSGSGSFSGSGQLPPGLGATLRATAGAAAVGAAGGGVVPTTGGLKQTGQIADEARINAALAPGGGGGIGGGTSGSAGGDGARSTFGTLRDFNDFSRGLEVLPSLTADAAAVAAAAAAGPGPGPGSAGSDGGPRTATRLGSPRAPVRVYAAALPPAAISLPASALSGLRESVRSTASTKTDFVRSFKPLDSHDLDLKKTLGEPMDMSKTMARVEPVRDTKMLPRADYVSWQDYSATCRTAPTGWYERHPTAAAQDTGQHKYPWC